MNRRKIILLCILLVVLILTISSPLLAKYIKNQQSQINITADKFYFTVDLLGDTNDFASLNKTYSLYGGDDKEIKFNVQNYFDDFRITEADIKYNLSYEVILPGGSSYSTSNVTLTGTGNQTLNKGDKAFKESILFVGHGYDNETQVVITITSSSPYQKTMVLTFVFNTFESEIEYYIVDEESSLYAELFVISNVDIDIKELKIDLSAVNSLSTNLQTDFTNTYLLVDGSIPGYQSSTQIYNTKKILAGEAISIKFFKTDISTTYALSNVKINKTDGIFEVIIPNV